MIARDRALSCHRGRRHPPGWVGTLEFVSECGIDVALAPLPFGQREFTYDDLILIEVDQPREYQLWYLAHAIGHVLLHAGDQRWLLLHTFGLVPKQEEGAERFAAWFLAPALVSCDPADYGIPPEKLAYRLALETVCGERSAA